VPSTVCVHVRFCGLEIISLLTFLILVHYWSINKHQPKNKIAMKVIKKYKYLL
jgi:hypothetical protein